MFVYSLDPANPERQRLSRQLIAAALSSRRGVISTQVVQEFLNVALRRFARPILPSDSREYVHTVLAHICLHFPSITFYANALTVQVEAGYSWYDTLIVAAALELGCSTLFTEDLQDGRFIRSLAIRNPFV